MANGWAGRSRQEKQKMNTNDIIEYAKTLKIRSDEIRAESKRLSALAGK